MDLKKIYTSGSQVLPLIKVIHLLSSLHKKTPKFENILLHSVKMRTDAKQHHCKANRDGAFLLVQARAVSGVARFGHYSYCHRDDDHGG